MILSWRSEYFEPVITIVLFTIFYLIYHYDVFGYLISTHFANAGDKKFRQAFSIFIQRITAVIMLGIFPIIVIKVLFKQDLSLYGIASIRSPLIVLLTLIICVLLFPVLFVYSKSPDVKKKVSQVRPDEWNAGVLALNVVSWIVYLMAYEFCMRGFLLFSLAKIMGSWPAIIVMTSIYTFVHLAKEKGEVFGSIIIGIVFGILSLSSKSILPALIIHAYIALSMDLLTIPDRRRKSQ